MHPYSGEQKGYRVKHWKDRLYYKRKMHWLEQQHFDILEKGHCLWQKGLSIRVTHFAATDTERKYKGL
jgi:hypothetical protein